MGTEAGASSAVPGGASGLAIAGLIGSELAQHVRVMDDALHAFQVQRHITRDQMNALRAAVAAARELALQSQQIARIAGGRLRQSHERLHLDQVVSGVLAEREPYLRRAGAVVEQHLRDVEVIVDPGLLVNLVGIACDWAMLAGSWIQVWLEMKHWPEHALLTFKVGTSVRTASAPQPETEGPDSVAWHLLLQLAHAMGVPVERFAVAGHCVVQMEFPRTVRQLEGLTAVEVDGGVQSSLLSEAHSEPRYLAGHRVLLISADPQVKEEVERVGELTGMVIDCSPTVRQAVRYCELDMPHVILIDERLRDHQFEELRQDILRQDLNFPFAEIAEENNVFEVSSWMAEAMSRISRDALQHQLASVIAMELAKVI